MTHNGSEEWPNCVTSAAVISNLRHPTGDPGNFNL